jgi:hypothetical protein
VYVLQRLAPDQQDRSEGDERMTQYEKLVVLLDDFQVEHTADIHDGGVVVSVEGGGSGNIEGYCVASFYFDPNGTFRKLDLRE